MVCILAVNPAWSLPAEEHPLAALMVQVRQGSERALAQLYDASNRMVYGLALRITGDASSAEDITLEVYLQVWRTAESYEPARGSVTSWLVTIVRSRAIDWLRRRRARRQELEDPLDEVIGLRDARPNPEAITMESGRARVVRNAMAELPPDQRQLIELSYFSGMSHNEIARSIGVPLGTVKTRIRLGMVRLRESLGPFAEGL